MLRKRIIACLDVRDGRVVKGRKFSNIQDVANPVDLAIRYSQEKVDELVFYDITATAEDRDIMLDVVRNVAQHVNIPFTIGGGVKSLADFDRLLKAGADKVSVNSAAVRNPQLIADAATKYGRQCVVLSIDAKRRPEGGWDVYVAGGRENTHIDAVEWALEGERLGAGEICINSIDADGDKTGYDLELNKELASKLSIPIIASGGAGEMSHFKDVFEVGADAALAASVFHYNEIKVDKLKEYLAEAGIPVRIYSN